MLRAKKEQTKFCPKIVMALIHLQKPQIASKTNRLSFKKPLAAKLWADCIKMRRYDPAIRLLKSLFGTLNIPSNYRADMGYDNRQG